MKGKILRMGLVVLGILLASSAFSKKSVPDAEVDLSVPNHIKIAQPFQINAYGDVGCSADIAMDVVLPQGIQLLKGNLHSEAKRGNRYTFLREEITAQITAPGIYEIYNILSVTYTQDSVITSHLPGRYRVYIYASKDTVLAFARRSDMEQAIRDSLVFPGVATRRSSALRDSIMRSFNAERLAKDSLVNALRQDMLHSDSIQYNKLDDYYTPEQVKRIKKYNLMYTPPQFDKIERLLRVEPSKKLSDEEVQTEMQIFRRHFTAQFQIDQRIIHEQDSTRLTRLLEERDSLKNIHRMEQNHLFDTEQQIKR